LWAYKEETQKLYLANCTYHCIIGEVRRTAPIIILQLLHNTTNNNHKIHIVQTLI